MLSIDYACPFNAEKVASIREQIQTGKYEVRKSIERSASRLISFNRIILFYLLIQELKNQEFTK